MSSHPWVVHGSPSEPNPWAYINNVAVDNINDRVYFIGETYAPLTIYNPDKTVGYTIPKEGGYLCCYTASGAFVWAVHIDSDWPKPLGVTCLNGFVYVSGFYGSFGTPDTVTFFSANGATSITLPAADSLDGFVAKYDSNGTPLWAINIKGTNIGQNSESPMSIAGYQDSLYVAGRTNSSIITFYNANGDASSTITGPENYGGFVAKYSDAGVCQWVARIDGSGFWDVVNEVDVTITGVYVTGSCENNAIIYNQDGSVFQTINGSDRIAFVAKYDETGQGVWASKIEGLHLEEGTSVSVSSDDFVYIMGTYTSPLVTIYGESQSTNFSTLTKSSSKGAFLIKYNQLGNVQWATKVEGLDYVVVRTVGTDGCVLVGYNVPNSTLSFYDQSSATPNTTVSTVSTDTCIARYLADGTLSWVTRISGSGDIYSWALDVLDNMYVFCGGYFISPSIQFYNAADLTTEVTSINRTSSGSEDVFLAKYNVDTGKLELTPFFKVTMRKIGGPTLGASHG